MTSPAARLVPVALCAAFMAASAGKPAEAHQISATFARLEPTSDPARMVYTIRIAARDLAPPGSDRVPTAAEIVTARDRLAGFLTEGVRFASDGQPCRAVLAKLVTIEDSRRLVQATLDVACPASIRELTLDYSLFLDQDPRHVGFVAVGRSTASLSAPDRTRLSWRPGHDPPSGLLGFAASGVEHIAYGLDHILFLVSLLLMAVVTRASSRQETAIRPARAALVYAGAIVTSFTIAHSLTLIGAALGWFDLPGRLVESVIAGSILFVAVENAVRFDPPRRYLVTFLFGLIHGLGFASMLRPLLPPHDVVLPLLAFNAGVELGQLALVLLGLPILYLVTRAIGAANYRRVILPVTSLVLATIALIWLLERVFDMTILGL
jgi:hypothetical protein